MWLRRERLSIFQVKPVIFNQMLQITLCIEIVLKEYNKTNKLIIFYNKPSNVLFNLIAPISVKKYHFKFKSLFYQKNEEYFNIVSKF